MNTVNEIRSQFLNFFASRGHQIVPSSPLVPGNDPTLLFTNAGMVQFKDVFLGSDRRAYNRATTSQRCVRAGGKHNDLENVGHTARHHTFFEMLGNFSFGDYFKNEAIRYCWELLTQGFGLDEKKLWVTVYEDDDEAADIWLQEIGVDPSRFSRCGAKDNFWSMGDTGPCGPCSEVFYDHGPEIPGGPPGSPDEDADRYIEIWNLVFMQFDRAVDGTMTPLPKPSVDTGMGLERLAAVLQGVHSNYEIDLFVNLLKATAEVTGTTDLENNSLKVIADHIRSCAFLVVDGVVPANEGRGYVLRRIVRRAIRHGHNLGRREPFFYLLVDALIAEMGEAYPELASRKDIVQRVLKQEELRFAETLDQGMRIFEHAVAELSGKELSGETVFKLYDTYGFPADLTADVARERGLSVDMAEFDRLMESQRARARASSRFAAIDESRLSSDCVTEFTGYSAVDGEAAVSALIVDGVGVERIAAGQSAWVIVEQTPFYAESGGQVGDRGRIVSDSMAFEVHDTQKLNAAHAHVGGLKFGELAVGDQVSCRLDTAARKAIARHHTGTHLLHAALRCVLGDHVKQKGSLVAPDRLRFDFSHFEPVTSQQLSEIESMVNTWVLANDSVHTETMSMDEAVNSGAMALFGEKYDETVRVLSVGDYSRELCGGTHVLRSGDIGPVKLLQETGIAAGVRRIEAVAGTCALDWINATQAKLQRLAAIAKTEPDGLEPRVSQLVERNRELEKELQRSKAKMAANRGGELAAGAVEIGGMKVLAVRMDGADPKALRDTVDQLKNKLGRAIVVLGAAADGKVSLVAGVSKDESKRIKAGPLINHVATQVGGKGGGRPEMAQAGGSRPENLDSALASVADWVRAELGGN